MVELFSLDDVGQAYDIALNQPDRIGVTLGRHTNDYMTSFYAKTPSASSVERGWGGREIEPAGWRRRSILKGRACGATNGHGCRRPIASGPARCACEAAADGLRHPVQVLPGNFQRRVGGVSVVGQRHCNRSSGRDHPCLASNACWRCSTSSPPRRAEPDRRRDHDAAELQPRRTAYRYIRELAAAGFLKRIGGAYSLGPRIVELDYFIRENDPNLNIIQQVLRALSERLECDTLWTSFLGDHVVVNHHERGTAAHLVSCSRGAAHAVVSRRTVQGHCLRTAARPAQALAMKRMSPRPRRPAWADRGRNSAPA